MGAKLTATLSLGVLLGFSLIKHWNVFYMKIKLKSVFVLILNFFKENTNLLGHYSPVGGYQIC